MRKLRFRLLALLLAGLLPAGPAALAGPADVVGVKVTKTGERVYRFNVTVRHHDQGWKHYANAWEVVAPDGRVLATRVLAHPHDNEQPFTRSLSGIGIAAGIARVTVRANDLVHGLGGAEAAVDVPE